MSLFVANTDTAVACASNAAVGIISIISDTKTLKIKEIGISFDGTDPTKTPIRVDLVRADTDGTGTSGTVRATDGALDAALATTKYNYSSGNQPTSNVAIFRSWYVSPAGGLWVMQFPLGDEPLVWSGADVAWLRATTVTASGTPNALAYISFEE